MSVAISTPNQASTSDDQPSSNDDDGSSDSMGLLHHRIGIINNSKVLMEKTTTTTTTGTTGTTKLEEDTLEAAKRSSSSETPAVYKLCVEEFIHILTFSTPQDLLHISSVSVPLSTMLNFADPLLWKLRCADLWKGKQGFCKFVDKSMMRHLAKFEEAQASAPNYLLTHQNHRALLEKRKYNREAHRCWQQQNSHHVSITLANIRDLLLEPLPYLPEDTRKQQLPAAADLLLQSLHWWDMSPDEKLASLRSSRIKRQQQQMQALSNHDQLIHLYDHSSSSDDNEEEEDQSVTWKFAFFMSVRDAKRTTLSKSELVRSKWMMAFRALPSQSFQVEFTRQNQLLTPTHGALVCQLAQGGRELNIANLPALFVSRVGPALFVDEESLSASDAVAWGWKISNRFAEIWSVDTPTPVYLQRLRRTCSPRPP